MNPADVLMAVAAVVSVIILGTVAILVLAQPAIALGERLADYIRDWERSQK